MSDHRENLPEHRIGFRLMTITLPAGTAEATRRDVMADIGAALARIAQDHGIDITALRRKAPPRLPRAPGVTASR